MYSSWAPPEWLSDEVAVRLEAALLKKLKEIIGTSVPRSNQSSPRSSGEMDHPPKLDTSLEHESYSYSD